MKNPSGPDIGWSVGDDPFEGNWLVFMEGNGEPLEVPEMVQQPLEGLLHRGEPLTTPELLDPLRAIDRLDRCTNRAASIEAGLRALRVPEVAFEIDRRDDCELGEGRRRFPGL